MQIPNLNFQVFRMLDHLSSLLDPATMQGLLSYMVMVKNLSIEHEEGTVKNYIYLC